MGQFRPLWCVSLGKFVSIRFVFIGEMRELKNVILGVSWITLLFHAEGFKFGCVPVNGRWLGHIGHDTPRSS
jgi:hypothetical protein